jgi:ferredoxin-NADP reductase
MAGTALPGRLSWTLATVAGLVTENPRTRTLVLTVPGWPGHRPGQHVDIRLTAEDGYQAERSYSIASAPAGERVELTVERLDDGEVSPYFVDELRPGDQLELRGPIGGYFAWSSDDPSPLLLAGGGSGIVPLMAILRTRAAMAASAPVRLLTSFRTEGDMIYREEIERLALADAGIVLFPTLTRAQPPGWTGYTRRVDRAMLADVAWPATENPLAFVCGPTPFVEVVAEALVALGYAPARVRTERFGPSGG